MSIYDYEAAFGAADKTTKAMREAIADWFSLYYRSESSESIDSCQRIAYTLVNKLVKAIFGEYTAASGCQEIADQLSCVKERAMQLALVGGECYIKPCPAGQSFQFTLIPRDNVLIFGADASGTANDVGMVECSTYGKFYYTLLERRTLDENGLLTITNRLYRSGDSSALGTQVKLWEHPAYAQLEESYQFPVSLGGIGLVQMKTPMLNCVDGSADGVSVYAAVTGLIHNLDENEAQLNGEFRRGESRLVVSRDLLTDGQLQDHLFVGLDDDPEQVGMTVFNPQLRVDAYLARKQEYLRNVESVVGLRRGMLSDANIQERTATEIASSAGDFNLTVIQLQQMWQRTMEETLQLCEKLCGMYDLPALGDTGISIDWGNSTLYDEDKMWQEYREMVQQGLLAPEVALGWRFGLPATTEEERSIIRQRYMS